MPTEKEQSDSPQTKKKREKKFKKSPTQPVEEKLVEEMREKKKTKCRARRC
jgi:hypothetical protein